jgi:hypothetical protein
VNCQNVTNVTKGHWRSVAVQFVSEPEIYHGAEFTLRAAAGVLVQEPLPICLRCRSKSKKCDKQLTFIVRVMVRYFINFSSVIILTASSVSDGPPVIDPGSIINLFLVLPLLSKKKTSNLALVNPGVAFRNLTS